MTNTKFPQSKKTTITIPSFEKGISLKYDPEITSLAFALNLENFSFSSGSLKDGIGVCDFFKDIATEKDAKLLTSDIAKLVGIEKVFYFYKFNSETNSHEDKIIFASEDFKIYYINLYSETKQLCILPTVQFTSSPEALRYRLNGEDVIIFTSETDNMVVWDGTNTPYEVLDTPHISSMAVHFERLFATVDGEKNSVWFSDELDPTEWSISLDEAGFIELVDERGALQKVVSFNDYVYIFREYGISRLTAYGDQTQFSCSNLYVSSGKINPKSVCVCGDKILFLSSDGLYKFDGVDTVKILENISPGFEGQDNQNAVSCFFESSYFLACNFNESTNKKTLNTILEIDTENYTLKNILKGLEVKYITCINSSVLNGVIAVAKNPEKNAFSVGKIVKNGLFFEKISKKVWKSQIANVGDSFCKKQLRNVSLFSKTPIVLKVFADEKQHEICFSGCGFQTKKCLISGNNFQFELECTATSPDIKNLKFEFYKLRRNPL